jgi:site-specific recombinase XerD
MKMNKNNNKMIEECFKKARITDELCEISVIKYRESLKRFFRSVGDKSFADLEMKDIEDYIFKAKKRGNSNSGIVSVIYALKWAMKKLQAQCFIEKKIDLEKICKPKIKKQDVNYLTKEEIEKFIGVIKNELESSEATRKIRTMTLYVFLLETGARINEALSIKTKDIDFESREVAIIGKGSKPRKLLFYDQSEIWIRKYLKKRKGKCEYLFSTINGKSKWSYNDVGRSFQRYRKLSGITKNFTIHTFRHTFATQLLLNGVPLNQVSFLLGHANLETTMKYYIGTIKIAEARKFMKDEYFDFIPKAKANSRTFDKLVKM